MTRFAYHTGWRKTEILTLEWRDIHGDVIRLRPEIARIEHYNRAWRTARQKAGLPGRLCHDARRTAVRNMDRAGVPRQTAKQITGHKTDAIYNRCRIVHEQDIREGLVQAQTYLAASITASATWSR